MSEVNPDRSPYPATWEQHTRLSDGTAVDVRPIRPSDAAGLIEFHAALSPETIHRRFFGPHRTLSERDAEYFTVVDYRDRFALLATVEETIVGVARYDRHDSTCAEVAFVVADSYQGKGIGTLLLERLAAVARVHGIAWFDADTLVENTQMLAVFHASGFPITASTSYGVVHVRFPITKSDDAQPAFRDGLGMS